ncbi:hypothetical protein ES705_19572 [subsurface metagenome]
MTQPIDPKDLEHLIRWHQDNTTSYVHLMSPSVRYLEEQTVKALQHYRNLIVTTPNRQESAVNPNG